jgi:hypothetical protein
MIFIFSPIFLLVKTINFYLVIIKLFVKRLSIRYCVLLSLLCQKIFLIFYICKLLLLINLINFGLKFEITNRGFVEIELFRFSFCDIF